MVTLHLVLVDTALELIPSHLQSHPSVVKLIKRQGAAAKLLDSSLHHKIMQKLPSSHKRGRPDILQHFLLDTLGSPGVLEGKIKLYFRTHADFYTINSEMRPPRNYDRFKGLMAQLLDLGHVPPKPPHFIEKASSSFEKWIHDFPVSNRILCIVEGTPTKLSDLFDPKSMDMKKDLVLLIGGFQEGGFSSIIHELECQKVSLYKAPLDSWAIIQRVVCAWEQKLGII